MASIPKSDRELVTQARRWAGAGNSGWLVPTLLTLLILVAGVLEWAYSPVEQALGAYMLDSQDLREEVGRGWDLNREGTEALDKLSDMAALTRQRRAAGATLDTWEQIPAILDSFQVFSISPERFLTLYGQLPTAFQESLVDPISLLRSRSSGDWRRVFFVEEDQLYKVYLISADNFVLHESRLSDDFFNRYESLRVPIERNLRELSRFPLVLDAETFFNALAPSGPVELDGSDIRWISGLEGELTLVGLPTKPEDGMWQIAFEVQQGDTQRVYVYWLTKQIGQQLAEEVQRMIPGGGMDL